MITIRAAFMFFALGTGSLWAAEAPRSLSVVLANGQEVSETEVLFAPPMINGLPIRYEDSYILPSFKINKVIANRFCSLAGLTKASHFEPVGTPRGYTGDVSVFTLHYLTRSHTLEAQTLEKAELFAQIVCLK